MPSLFEPLSLGAVRADNRVLMAPLTRMRATAPGDVPNDLMREYYVQRAGAGLLISEGTQISPEGKGYMDTGARPERISVVSGPNLAREIALREPAAGVIACADESVGAQVQDVCHGRCSVPTPPSTCSGCELGGAYKNVVGLAVGMAVGLGFGDNTTASLITRGIAETARLAMASDANPMTLMGLAGLGDLVATCSSPLSRNRTFGEKLGQGMTTDEIIASTRQVAEGAKSCASLLRARPAPTAWTRRSPSTSTPSWPGG